MLIAPIEIAVDMSTVSAPLIVCWAAEAVEWAKVGERIVSTGLDRHGIDAYYKISGTAGTGWTGTVSV